MRFLLFSDVHSSQGACRRLVELSRDVDVVIGAGDFGVMRRRIDTTVDYLKEIDRPAIVVPGNAESAEELRDACRAWPSAHVLHGNGVEVNGVAFYGLGGGVPVTPFGAWSYDFPEDEAADLLRGCPDNAVLVTHSPPYGVLDTNSSGRRCGSTAIRDTVQRAQPRLTVCGHIHDCGGRDDVLDGLPVVNAGPDGIVWDLDSGRA